MHYQPYTVSGSVTTDMCSCNLIKKVVNQQELLYVSSYPLLSKVCMHTSLVAHKLSYFTVKVKPNQIILLHSKRRKEILGVKLVSA